MDQNLRGRAGQPPRPRPPKPSQATYWRRRVVVLAVGAGLLTTLSWAVNGLLVASSTAGQAGPPGSASRANSTAQHVSTRSDHPAPSPSPSPRPHATPKRHRKTTGSHTSGTTRACARGGVTLSLSSPQGWYQSGSSPRFTVRASSSQSQPCQFNMGSKFVAVVVAHSGRSVWSSADCASGAGSKPVVLSASTPAVLRVSWDRRTSSPGCAGSRHLVLPGEYQATAVAGSLHSKPVNFVLGAKGASGP